MQNRFITLYEEGSSTFGQKKTILMDLETGVNYLWINSGYAGGLTPLLNADGTPVVSELD